MLHIIPLPIQCDEEPEIVNMSPDEMSRYPYRYLSYHVLDWENDPFLDLNATACYLGKSYNFDAWVASNRRIIAKEDEYLATYKDVNDAVAKYSAKGTQIIITEIPCIVVTFKYGSILISPYNYSDSSFSNKFEIKNNVTLKNCKIRTILEKIEYTIHLSTLDFVEPAMFPYKRMVKEPGSCDLKDVRDMKYDIADLNKAIFKISNAISNYYKSQGDNRR